MVSEWRLAWVKTRTIQGLSGAFEEVTAWKEAKPEMDAYLRTEARIQKLMEYQAQPKLWCVKPMHQETCGTRDLFPTDPPDMLEPDARPRGTGLPKAEDES